MSKPSVCFIASAVVYRTSEHFLSAQVVLVVISVIIRFVRSPPNLVTTIRIECTIVVDFLYFPHCGML